ncbi:MAG: hypothetical protein AAF266_13885, partial [Planctomycetota bacterium]
ALEALDSFLPTGVRIEDRAIILDTCRRLIVAYQSLPETLRKRFGAAGMSWLVTPKTKQFDCLLEGLPDDLWAYFSQQRSLHPSTHSSTFGAARRLWERSYGSPEVRKRDVGHGLDWDSIQKEAWVIVQQGSPRVSRDSTIAVTKLRLAEVVRHAERTSDRP